MKKKRCKAITLDGTQCKYDAIVAGVCARHRHTIEDEYELVRKDDEE